MAASGIPNSDDDRLLSLVPGDGSAVGNTWLRERLGWEPARYFEIRNRLVEQRVLSIGRGRGGSVYRVKPTRVSEAAEEAAKPAGLRRPRESDLYGPVREALRQGWSNMLRHTNFLVQITGGGRKKTGGMWTRPDITVVMVDTYAYVPGKFIEVITYEIKAAENWNVSGVFEAASHSRFATQTYLLIHAPEGPGAVREDQRNRLQRECMRFGIGLVFCQDPGSYDTYDFVVDAEHRQPDPEEMNLFITQQLTEANRDQIAKWLK